MNSSDFIDGSLGLSDVRGAGTGRLLSTDIDLERSAAAAASKGVANT